MGVSKDMLKYQSIISNLKKQVAELKEELSAQDLNGSVPKSIKSIKETDNKDFEQLKSEMDQNFQKEIENRKSYLDNERALIEAGINLFQYKTDFERSLKENGKSHVKTKQAEDNMKNEQKTIDTAAENKKKIDDAWSNIKKYRDKLPSIWKKKKMKDLQLTVLQVLLQNHITSVDNVILKNKEAIEDLKIRARDVELKHLYDMINLRDSVISQTKKQLTANKMELIIEEDSMEAPDAITKRMKMSFPTLTFSNTPVGASSKNRTQSVNVRIEGKGDLNKGDANTSDTSIPTITSNSKHISGTLKPLQPVIRNNYIRNNLRYIRGPGNQVISKFGGLKGGPNAASLPKLTVKKLEKPPITRKPSHNNLAPGSRKGYLGIRGRAQSPSGASITSERTTSSLPHVIRSDTEASSGQKQPMSYSVALKQMKKKPDIQAKDRMRLERFKKENFLYSAANKKMNLAQKYQSVPATTSTTPNASNATYLNRVENPPITSNIIPMEERKGDSKIPSISYTERMKNNMQRLNLLPVADNSNKYKPPIKSILKRRNPPANTVSEINSSNLKANTLANSMRHK